MEPTKKEIDYAKKIKSRSIKRCEVVKIVMDKNRYKTSYMIKHIAKYILGYVVTINPGIECFLRYKHSRVDLKIGQKINVYILGNHEDRHNKRHITVSVKHVPDRNFTPKMREMFTLVKNH
jgi:hypothetical protein